MKVKQWKPSKMPYLQILNNVITGKGKAKLQIKRPGLQEHFQSHKFLLCYTIHAFFYPDSHF